jgi:uncharacterized membrane protein
LINIVLWLVGFVLLALGIVKAAPAFGKMQELDRLAENAKRYDSWRGGSRLTAADNDKTGADEMRDIMRRRALTWAAVGVVGIVLIVLGFAIK